METKKCCKDRFYKKKYYDNNIEKVKLSAKIWAENNPEKRREINKKYRDKNVDKIKKHLREYYKKNKEKLNEHSKEYNKNHCERRYKYLKEYRKNNPEKTRELYRQANKKRQLNPLFKINNTFSNLIRYSLKNGKNGYHWENLVDYTLQDLISRLEKLFKSGMNWNNYGAWHIDHILPVSSFNFESYEDEEFKKCWALSNLQPLWAIENLKKGNKILNGYSKRL